MNKLEALKCVEVTSQRQADNGTVSYFDPKTGTYYNLYENGYVRRSFGRKRLWNGKLSDEVIYQLNPTRMAEHTWNRHDGATYTYQAKERIMLETHEERMDCAARAVTNYRKTVKKNAIWRTKYNVLRAVQDEIEQYNQGNLTLDMSLNGIKELINTL
jgi:hypothetical protein